MCTLENRGCRFYLIIFGHRLNSVKRLTFYCHCQKNVGIQSEFSDILLAGEKDLVKFKIAIF